MMSFLQFMFIFKYIYMKLGFQCTTHSVSVLFFQKIWKKDST